MAKITLADAKNHLRVSDGAEDALISVWIKAAYLAVEGKIFRTVYEDERLLDEDEDPTGIACNDAINSAVLLIVGHLFTNREAVVQGQAAEVPMGAEWLLTPYINYAGGA